jgi:superoxide dismutase
MAEDHDNGLMPGILVLVKGRDASGNPQYAYAAIAFEKYDAFLDAQASGTYDLSAFGTILHYGEGQEPPLKVQKEMEEKYGALHDFEQQLMAAMKDATA